MRLLLVFLLLASGCARLGTLPSNAHDVLVADAQTVAAGDPSAPGPLPVKAYGVTLQSPAGGFPLVVYRPQTQVGPLPAVVFLPGRSAQEWQYESYGRALASHGFVVAMRGWYSPFRTDPELARDARVMGDWLIAHGLANPKRLGVAGHSMGGKVSILAAIDDDRFHAVVALDPDEAGATPVARGPIERLKAPLLVVGMELAELGWSVCATPENNFRSFFANAPPGSIELTMLGADHVQLMDAPDAFGMFICRVGTAQSQHVRTSVRGATVRFFERQLKDSRDALPQIEGSTVRIKQASR